MIYPRRRSSGRFFGRRVNCENVPILPAGAVGWVLDDPRKIPYLFIWKGSFDGEVKEAVRVASYSEPIGAFHVDWTGWVEVKRTDQTKDIIRSVLRAMPRNGGSVRLLVCSDCNTPGRALYGWEPGGKYTSSAQRCSWKCRACAGLRYASEGTYIPRQFRFLGGYPRQEPWYPYVFADANKAIRWIVGGNS